MPGEPSPGTRRGETEAVVGERFKPCELSRPVDGGVARMVSWIPQEIAVPGAVVGLKDVETGQRTAGWTVQSAAGPAVPAKILERQSRDYLKTREASDV